MNDGSCEQKFENIGQDMVHTKLDTKFRGFFKTNLSILLAYQ